MSAPYSGLPAAASVQQSIIMAQLELLRRLDPARVAAAKAALLRTIKLLGAAGLIVASTGQAQAPEGALLSRSRVQPSYTVGEASGSARIRAPGARAEPSSFLAEIRGDVTSRTSGAAEFGPLAAGDGAVSGFVVSLGARGDRGAILFTRPSGTPLSVGRYRISDRGNGADEILALVMTGQATKPTGVFRGQLGWLVVTAASDDRLTGRFQVDGVGFLAAEPGMEGRPVSVTGSFSATAAGS